MLLLLHIQGVCISVLGVVFTSVVSVIVNFCLENLSWLGLVLWSCRGLFVQEMQTGVNHIPAQSMVCSLSEVEPFMLRLLLPPLPLCWHHVMFTGPHSDPAVNEMSSTQTQPLKKTVILLKAFFGLNVVPHLSPQTAVPAQVGFSSRERNEWNGRAWRMPELLLVPGKHALLQPKGSHTQSKWLKSNCFGVCGLQVCPRGCVCHAGVVSVK